MCVCKFSDHVFQYIAIVAVWLHALFLNMPLWQSMMPVHLVVSMSQLSSWKIPLGRSRDAIARLHSKWRMCATGRFHLRNPTLPLHLVQSPGPICFQVVAVCMNLFWLLRCTWTSLCMNHPFFCSAVPLWGLHVARLRWLQCIWCSLQVPLLQRTWCGIRSHCSIVKAPWFHSHLVQSSGPIVPLHGVQSSGPLVPLYFVSQFSGWQVPLWRTPFGQKPL